MQMLNFEIECKKKKRCWALRVGRMSHHLLEKKKKIQ